MNLDRPKHRRYRLGMMDLETELLKKVASELAVKFSDLARMFPDQAASQLRLRLQALQDAGLVRGQELPGDATDETVWSITADGSKKAEAPKLAFAAFK